MMKKIEKECLITIGATAKFESLLQAALTPECLQAFAANSFTRLNFQCGESYDIFETLRPTETYGIDIRAFDFNKNGLNKEMRACQAKDGVSAKGLIICHAGAGTILDAMRLDLALMVVPNSTLLDNHQVELAEELERQGYATHSDTANLAKAITKACKKIEKTWGGRGHKANFSQIVDEVVGFEDDVRANLD